MKEMKNNPNLLNVPLMNLIISVHPLKVINKNDNNKEKKKKKL